MRRATLEAVAVLAIAAILIPGMKLRAQETPARAGEHAAKKGPTREAKTVTVEMKDFAFVPETVEINVGDTVTWVNRDATRHTATRNDPPAFNTGLLSQGESGSITFTTASDTKGFEYFCIPHQSFMRGHVRVMLPGSAPMGMSFLHAKRTDAPDEKPANEAKKPTGKRAAQREAKTVTVEMKDFAFVPETVEINVGDTVTWVNRDATRHTATRNDPPAFNTGLLSQGESSSITFTTASDAKGFEYFCIPHQSFMRGHVRVMLPGSSSMIDMHMHADKDVDK